MDLSVVVQDGREPALADLELHALALRVGLDLVFWTLPTAKYDAPGWAKTSALTDAAGIIDNDEESLMPHLFSTSIRSHIVRFSVWSGCDG